MKNVVANFTLGNQPELQADFSISEQEPLVAEFEVDVFEKRHDKLINRELPDQHPISAITGLEDALNSIDAGIGDFAQEVNEAITSVTNALKLEEDNRKLADKQLESSINAEAQARISADANIINTLQSKINRETSERIASDNELRELIESETAQREANDTSINARISREEASRKEGDDSLRADLNAEISRSTSKDELLQSQVDQLGQSVSEAIENEKNARIDADNGLSKRIDSNLADIEHIETLIPEQASSSNKLADKEFVNSSIATNTANFIGTFNSVAELEAYSGTLTNNDYAFVVGKDSVGNTVYDRYKYTDATTPASWIFEYELNNSSFTAAQWNAINSGATTELVNQITTNQGNITTIQTTIGGYGNIVTHNVSEFATAAQGTKADTAVQPVDLATVATSGSYNDLDDKPTIGNATLTIQKNGTAVDTFTANATADKAINITVPTDTNDLTNGAGYITGITSSDVTTALGYTPYNSSNPSGYQTASDVQTAIAGKQDALVSGTNIKTINNNSILGSGNLNIDGLPSQTGQNGKFLSTDGTNPSWQNVDALPSQTGQGGKFLTTNGTTASWADVGGGLEIGDIGFAPLGIDETKNKRRYLNGQVISQSQFATFTDKVKAAIALYPSLSATEANWQAEVTNSKLGQCGKFVIDDTAGTIRLPKVVNINGLTDLSLMGGIKAESLPNITGRVQSEVNFVKSDGFDGPFSFDMTYNYTIGTQNSAVFGLKRKLLFDASLSSSTYQNNAPVQQEAVQYPYFIQVATGSEESVDVSTEIQLNNPFFFGMHIWSDTAISNASWLISNGTYHSGATYTDFYEWLLKIHNGTLTVDGVSVKDYGASDITDYDYVINTADTTFRLPVKVKLASGNAVAGNGMTLGLTDGNNNFAGTYNSDYTPGGGANSYGFLKSRKDVYGKTLPATGKANNSSDSFPTYSALGITTDPTKSGIETSSSGLKLYFYVGETIQDANVINAAGVLTDVADLKGNTINKSSASDKETVVGWGCPNYNAGYTVSSGFTANTSGVLKVYVSSGYPSVNISVNNVQIVYFRLEHHYTDQVTYLVRVDKGDVVTFNGSGTFYPDKGV